MFFLSIFLIETTPLFAQSETNALPKLVPPYGQMPPTFWEQYGLAVIIGAIALLLIAGLAIWWVCRPKPPEVVPPEIQAREALNRWVGRPEDGACLSNISQILRRYIGRMFGLPAGELTTAEFCRELERNEQIGPELTQALSGFLRECDERKFSSAGSPASRHAACRALELIALAEKVRDRRNACPTEQ